MSLIEKLNLLVAEDPSEAQFLDDVDGSIEQISNAVIDRWRWGTVNLVVYRDKETGTEAGVLYRHQPEHGIYEDSVEVVPVQTKTVTRYLPARGE